MKTLLSLASWRALGYARKVLVRSSILLLAACH